MTGLLDRDLGSRLQRLEAAAAIRDLPPRYAAAFARLDLDALVELYVPDVALRSGDVGRAALRAYFERSFAGAEPGDGLHTVILLNGTHIIDFEDALAGDGATNTDSGRGTVYCHGEMQLMDGRRYTQAIVYTDSYARIGDQWYFAAQRIHELVYGVPPLTRPNQLPEAHWPASQIGRGTLPAEWPSWQAFWGAAR
jgi:ketosteroid isomerase-like protein